MTEPDLPADFDDEVFSSAGALTISCFVSVAVEEVTAS